MNLAQMYGLLANSSINWNDFLSKVIFQPDNAAQIIAICELSIQTKHSARMPYQVSPYYTSRRSLPTTQLLTNIVVCLGITTNETVSTITNAGTDTSGNGYIFIPAIITSLGSKTDVAAPALPSVATEFLKCHLLNLRYYFRISLREYSAAQFQL